MDSRIEQMLIRQTATNLTRQKDEIIQREVLKLDPSFDFDNEAEVGRRIEKIAESGVEIWHLDGVPFLKTWPVSTSWRFGEVSTHIDYSFQCEFLLD